MLVRSAVFFKWLLYAAAAAALVLLQDAAQGVEIRHILPSLFVLLNYLQQFNFIRFKQLIELKL